MEHIEASDPVDKLSYAEFKELLYDGKISKENLKAMYDAYIDDDAAE